jgi:hypothetical protein
MRPAGVPAICFLVLIQWSLVAGLLVLAWRHGQPDVAAGRARRRWKLAVWIAPLCLAGALGALTLMNGHGMGRWRSWMLFGALPVLALWGRVALLPTSPGPQSGARWGWPGLTGLLHFCLFVAACVWFCHWFVARDAGVLDKTPMPTAWLAASVALNRLAGVGELGVLMLAMLNGGNAGDAGALGARQARYGTLLVVWSGWRMVALGLTLALGMATDPFGPGFFMRTFQLDGLLLLGVRVLLGGPLPAIQGLLTRRLGMMGDGRRAAQQMPPALIMVAIGEILGAGLTFGTLGLGF